MPGHTIILRFHTYVTTYTELSLKNMACGNTLMPSVFIMTQHKFGRPSRDLLPEIIDYDLLSDK